MTYNLCMSHSTAASPWALGCKVWRFDLKNCLVGYGFLVPTLFTQAHSFSLSLSLFLYLSLTHTHTHSLLRSCTLKSLQLTLTRVWASCLVYLTALVRFPGENELTAPEKSTTISIWISLRRILEKAREDFKTEKYVERKKDISIWNKHIGKR